MTEYSLAIASDHGGFYLKNKIKTHLTERGIKVIDLGTESTDRVDYPDYANAMIEHIEEESVQNGILICGTGIGMVIAANRSSSVRATLCTSENIARSARLHNDANVLVLGSKIVDDELSIKIVDIFLNTEFEGGRHVARIAKIS